jgi:hypothetical protein
MTWALSGGPDGLRQYYRQWEETFDASRTEIEELTDAGDEVVALLLGVGRMKGSDAEIDSLRGSHLDTQRQDRHGTGVLDPPGSPGSRRVV